MVQLTYELRMRQQTTLTPRLQQSVKLLQMSTLDFSREVAHAIATNPFLEEQDESGDTEGAAIDAKDAHLPDASQEVTDTIGSITSTTSVDETSSVEYEQISAEISDSSEEFSAYEAAADSMSSYSGDYPTSNRNGEAVDTDVGQWARSHAGLHDALLEDLCAYPLTERDRMLVTFVIEALDEDGYLRVPFSELASDDQLDPAPTDDEWEVALRLVQQLAAPGLGARNLSECLLLQLRALDEDKPQRDLACKIVESALEKVGKCDYAGMARMFQASEEDVREACLLIRSLDPRPGSRYATVDPSCYVVPDVIVRKIGKRWVALSNNDAVPKAQLHTTYAKLFRESRYNDRHLMAKALQEARWLIRSLEQRNTTILRVAQAIVARQQTFFDYGDVALRPLMLSEIADELGMHESTVSRATSNKYLASPRGIFEFKHFFSRELATRSGGTCSAGAVRALIQEMIENEDPRQPLSDVMLAQKLAREGVVVARRTVSKYRAQIKYPSAELRRAP